MGTMLPRRDESAMDSGQGRSSDLPLVSVIMPVRNEAAHIARSLGAVLAQDYPADRVEVLLVDGQSDDDTLGIAGSLSGTQRVRVLANPQRLQAAAMNLALRHARGEIVIRVDGHTVIAPDYVRQCVTTLRATGAANVGGRMEASQQSRDLTPTGQAIALATGSRFGVPAAFRTSGGAQETDTVYMGAWPRYVLEAAGGFDARMSHNEDYELNFRIRRAGGRIYLNPAIRSTYVPRQSFAALARQYFSYGRGKARMLAKHPTSLRSRQLVAPAFVGAAALGFPFARVRVVRALWLAMLAAYAGLNVVASLRLIRRSPSRTSWQVGWRLPLVFLTIHTAWGAGFWWGWLRLLSRASRQVWHWPGGVLGSTARTAGASDAASHTRNHAGSEASGTGTAPVRVRDAAKPRTRRARRW